MSNYMVGPGDDESTDSESGDNEDNEQEDSHPDWSYEEASDYYRDNGF